MFKYVFGLLICLISLIAIVMIPASSIARSLADWRASANGAIVAKENRAIVEAQQDGLTDRSKIEWEAKVEIEESRGNTDVKIARINADAEKKTSFAYSFYLLIASAIWFFFSVTVGNFIKKNRKSAEKFFQEMKG